MNVCLAIVVVFPTDAFLMQNFLRKLAMEATVSIVLEILRQKQNFKILLNANYRDLIVNNVFLTIGATQENFIVDPVNAIKLDPRMVNAIQKVNASVNRVLAVNFATNVYLATMNLVQLDARIVVRLIYS
jgi:hypothetical protein